MPLCILHLLNKNNANWTSVSVVMTILVTLFAKLPLVAKMSFLYFLIIFLKIRVYLVKETLILKLIFCCSATRGRNLLFISKLHIDYSYIPLLS